MPSALPDADKSFNTIAATSSRKTSTTDLPAVRALLPFAIGGTAGIASTTCVHPIDMVKVRLQLAGEGSRGGVRPTFVSVARQVVAEGGVLNLYSGLSAGYLRQVVYGTARLGLFATFMDMFEQRAQVTGSNVGFAERCVAGLGAGGLGALIGTPAEVVLVRMQSDSAKPKEQQSNYRSVFDALARIARSEGIRGLWAGACPTIVRAMASNFGQLTFFSESKSQLQRHTNLSAPATTVTASCIAGFFAAFFSLPLDMVKTRIQQQFKGSAVAIPYDGAVDCIVKIAKNEGYLRFFRGFMPYFLRMAPHS